MISFHDVARDYWNLLADEYIQETRISLDDFHFGPLLPGNDELDILPHPLKGVRCLELGCGGGQNSIYLARQGADCVGLDLSKHQLEHARTLAAEAGVEMTFAEASMETIGAAALGTFDLVHSTYALSFAEHPDRVIGKAAGMLNPGGILLVTTGHPVFAGEWMELEEDGYGTFLTDYFDPPDDVRPLPDGRIIRSRTYPVSHVFEWIKAAGLHLRTLLEPEPIAIDELTEDEIRQRVPYDSPAWRELYPKLACTPVAVIYEAVKPPATPGPTPG